MMAVSAETYFSVVHHGRALLSWLLFRQILVLHNLQISYIIGQLWMKSDKQDRNNENRTEL